MGVNMKIYIILTALFIAGPAVAETPKPVFKSGPFQATLIELFTSEGCSSCPAADKWLGRLRNEKGLWTNFVPVGFHVDYWDYIGWKDPLASKKFTLRQRAYARKWRAPSVYTPNFVLNGDEWRGWFGKPRVPKPSSLRVGFLEARQLADFEFEVTFRPVSETKAEWKLVGALLVMGYLSQVKAGENRGRNLVQNFSVVEFVQAKMNSGHGQGKRIQFKKREKAGGDGLAVAFWVSSEDGLTPLQATGGYISY